MIDIHTHVLPGLDDGAPDVSSAIAMCRMAAGDGIRTMVLSPHFHRDIFPTPSVEQCDALRTKLQERCEGAGLDLHLLAGSDCHLHTELLANLRAGTVPTIARGRYFLLELPESRLPSGLDRLLFETRVGGFRPVITHPERHEQLATDLSVLEALVRNGAWAQVTAGSLTGDFGADVREVAERMVECHLVQIIASDAHDTERRPPVLSAARDVAEGLVGADLARRMVEDVPLAIVQDREIDFPPPATVAPARPRPFWRRFLDL